jgi:hypothetical protein
MYVAEAGINAIAVVRLGDNREGEEPKVRGLIPTGWWPSSVAVSTNGSVLYVASANGRGALPNSDGPPNDLGSPRSSTLGTVNIIPVPSSRQLTAYSLRVLANNGFIPSRVPRDPNPIPSEPGVASAQIKHVIFINKENAGRYYPNPQGPTGGWGSGVFSRVRGVSQSSRTGFAVHVQR